MYLRNSNWDPDFSKSVRTFDDIYFKIKGETIDGYIAVDLQFAESLLRVTGPVFLSSYNEDITAENLMKELSIIVGLITKMVPKIKSPFGCIGRENVESIFP